MARKYKKTGSTSILLILILLIVMAYAGFELYDFIQKNNLSPLKIDNPVKIQKTIPQKNNNSNPDINKNTQTNEETKNLNSNNILYPNNTVVDNNLTTNDNTATNKNNQTKVTQKHIIDKTSTPIIVTEENKDKNSKNNGVFSLYYITLDSNDEFVHKKISLTLEYTDSPIFAVIAKLVSYHPDEPFYSFIPKGTKLKGAWIKTSILYLNFSKEFLNNQNGYSAIEAQIQQITNTAFQFKNISGIRIQIEGQNVKYFSDEGFLLDIVFKRT